MDILLLFHTCMENIISVFRWKKKQKQNELACNKIKEVITFEFEGIGELSID